MYLVNNLSDDDFLILVKNKIRNKEPFSFTRLRDGEISILLTGKLPKKWKWSDIYEFNNEIDAESESKKIIEKVLKDSDVIGLANINNKHMSNIIKNDNMLKKWQIPKSIIDKDIIVADHLVVRNKYFGDVNNFKELLQDKTCCIISPNTEHLNRNLSPIFGNQVSFFNTPMKINISDRTKLIENIKKINSDVILFGCTVGGKDFSTILRDCGKVVIDYGSTLDAWSGIISRSSFMKGEIYEHCVINNY